MTFEQQIANRMNEIGMPKCDLDDPLGEVLADWMMVGGLLIVRHLPDGTRNIDVFLPADDPMTPNPGEGEQG